MYFLLLSLGHLHAMNKLKRANISFLVEFDVPLANYIENRFALQDFLSEHFNRKIDLANPQSLKPFYKQRILDQLTIPISI